MRTNERKAVKWGRAGTHFVWGCVLGVVVAMVTTIGTSQDIRISYVLVSAAVFGILAAVLGMRFWKIFRKLWSP